MWNTFVYRNEGGGTVIPPSDRFLEADVTVTSLSSDIQSSKSANVSQAVLSSDLDVSPDANVNVDTVETEVDFG